MAEAKKKSAESTEAKVAAKGELDGTSKELVEDVEAKGTLHQGCVTKAAANQAEVQSRAEELKALADAKEVIIEHTGGLAVTLAASYLQMSSRQDLLKYEALRIVCDLSQKQ